MTTIKKFAKLFDHKTMGQMLVQRCSNEIDAPGVLVTFDPGMDELDPCDVFIAVKGGSDNDADQAADALFERFDEAMAVDVTKAHLETIKKMFSQQETTA